MKKRIIIITCDENAAVYHMEQIQSLFRDKVVVSCSTVRSTLKNGVAGADLYCITTDALEQLPDLQKRLPEGAETVSFSVTFSQDMLARLNAVPAGTTALFVNLSEKMSQECITSLNQLGINHIRFLPYYPGADERLAENVFLAVTPGEERYVPPGIRQVISLGQRKIDCNTVVEVLLKLKFYEMLEDPFIKAYFSSIASNSYSFDELFGRSLRLESSFQGLIDTLDIGIIGINEHDDIFVCNKKAEKITGISLSASIGQKAEQTVPFLPFSESRSSCSPRKISDRLIRLHGVPVNVSIIPIIRSGNHMGAIAMLQHFVEEEERQHKMRIQLFDKGHQARYTFDDIIGTSPAICNVRDIASKMARTKSSILITGESGTGKELFAHAIHNASPRRHNPFIAINCAALPENLLESELFGYVDGAFTGAKKGGKMGLFEFAHTGTFFLDEVEGMSPLLQIKLLRVLQEQEVMRIGDNRLIHVDVRIIAATNQMLEQLVEDGAFREDLYYRLNTLPVNLPPLRERTEDILPLIEEFQKNLGGIFSVSPKVLKKLLEHPWNGNIRELRNYVEYFSYLDKPVIDLEDLPPGFHCQIAHKKTRISHSPDTPGSTLHEIAGKRLEEYRFILTALAQGRTLGITVGREYMAREAQKSHILLSQYEIRQILSSLETLGYVKISKGRGGTRITEKGVRLLETG